jgi:hypothetical protein
MKSMRHLVALFTFNETNFLSAICWILFTLSFYWDIGVSLFFWTFGIVVLVAAREFKETLNPYSILEIMMAVVLVKAGLPQPQNAQGVWVLGYSLFKTTPTQTILALYGAFSILIPIILTRIFEKVHLNRIDDLNAKIIEFKNEKKSRDDAYDALTSYIARTIYKEIVGSTAPGREILAGQTRVSLYLYHDNSFQTLKRKASDPKLEESPKDRSWLKSEGILKEVYQSDKVVTFRASADFWEAVEIYKNQTPRTQTARNRIKREADACRIKLPEDIDTLINLRLRSTFYCGSPLILDGTCIGIFLFETNAEIGEVEEENIVRTMNNQKIVLETYAIFLKEWKTFYNHKLDKAA